MRYVADGFQGDVTGRLQLPLEGLDTLELALTLIYFLPQGLGLLVKEQADDPARMLFGQQFGDGIDR